MKHWTRPVLRWGIALLGGLVISCFPVRAQEPSLLTTGVHYPPFTGTDLPNGGMFTDIITRIFAEMGEEISLKRLPWKRAFLQAETGDALGTFPWETRPDIDGRFHISDPVIHLWHYIYVDQERGPDLKTEKDLARLRYCLPLGYRAHGLVAEFMSAGRLQVEQPVSMTNCFEMLRLGRVDFVSLSAMAAQQHARMTYGYVDGVRKVPVGAVSVSLHLLVSRKVPDSQTFLNRFNKTLAGFRDTGRLEEIITPHLWVP